MNTTFSTTTPEMTEYAHLNMSRHHTKHLKKIKNKKKKSMNLQGGTSKENQKAEQQQQLEPFAAVKPKAAKTAEAGNAAPHMMVKKGSNAPAAKTTGKAAERRAFTGSGQ